MYMRERERKSKLNTKIEGKLMTYTNHSLHNPFLACWDLHNLAVLNADISYMEANATPLPPSSEDNYSNFLSTGYLEDALIEFSLRFKRRRLALCTNAWNDHIDHHKDNFATLDALDYWNNRSKNYSVLSEEEFSHASLLTHDMHYCSGEGTPEKAVREMSEEAVNFIPELKAVVLDEVAVPSDTKLMDMNNYTSTTPTLHAAYNYSSYSYSTDSSISADEKEKMSKRKAVGMTSRDTRDTKKNMVYPFGLVKPGGEEGDITLKDINKRIMRPPTRPLKHPVGDFACRPGVLPHGPGLSGKAVVALTRIHTQGRGTITIIRTKG